MFFSYKNFNEKCTFMEMKMGQTILCFAILFLYTLLGEATAIEPVADPSGCNRKCGDIVVPFPFGFGNSSECFKDSGYQLVCNGTTLLTGNIPFVNFSLEEGTAVVDLNIAFNCRGGLENKFSSRVRFRRTSFTFSSTANMFTAIGCNTVAQISDGGKETGKFVSGCLSMCKRGTRIKSLAALVKQTHIRCSGVGCCQTPIPQGLKTLNISLDPYDDSDQSDNNTCSYGFLSGANFTLKMSPERVVRSPVVLDWAVGKMTCEEAKRNGTEYICGSNTNCINSTNGYGFGYRCLCNEGFEGNAYTRNGCTDINECLYRDGDPYPCKGNCKNMVGNYTCSCSFGYEGNGKIGCSMKAVTKALLVTAALFVLVTSVLISLWLYKKKIQRSNQQRNGGEFMDKLSVKCFKRSQLEKATNNFDSRRMLGEGANGWVYRGSLENMVEIAVKKSKLVDQDQIEQFLNEADIVSKINHKNVVKLLGLCLDSKVPMLVYEFVPNGTLFQHLHQNRSRWLDSWRNCLRVAAETARALDYMHSQADPLILHRDVKTSNILLDGKNTAKVADFGASKLIRMDRTIAPTQGQGTMGYLDPEYLQTGDLTTMSDVYAFGVVLMELLSKRKPISLGESGEAVALVKVFTSSIANNQFDNVLRVAEVTEQETEQVHLVARLAVRCVAMPSMNRPSMTEVADTLNGLSKEYSSYPLEGSGEETVNLLADQDSMTMSLPFDIEYSGNM